MPVILQNGIEQGIREYERLAANDAAWVETGENALNSLGYALLRTDAVDPAVALFRYVTQVYPDSWNAWDSLGEAQLAAGDTLAGRRSYAQSLRLNPDNETAREIVGAENAPE
jgi:Flp pilus assembly protein TadD